MPTEKSVLYIGSDLQAFVRPPVRSEIKSPRAAFSDVFVWKGRRSCPGLRTPVTGSGGAAPDEIVSHHLLHSVRGNRAGWMNSAPWSGFPIQGPWLSYQRVTNPLKLRPPLPRAEIRGKCFGWIRFCDINKYLRLIEKDRKALIRGMKEVLTKDVSGWAWGEHFAPESRYPQR